MTQTLTTKALRTLRDSLKSWQDGYDPVDDKEQYEMFVTAETAVGELLANREAQPVAEVLSSRSGNDTSTIDKALPAGTKVYTAPPAPAVPDFKALAENLVENLVDCGGADEKAVEQYLAFAEKTCRAAMLAQPQIEPQNIPNNIPDGLAAAVNRLLDSDGSRGCFSAVRSYDAREEIERLLVQPVSQGCKLVPVEPTEEMIAAAMGISETSIAIYKRMLAAAPEGGNG